MGRYYEIRITESNTGELVNTADGYPFNELDSRGDNLLDDPGALQIDLDIPIAAYHQPVSQAMLRIWGVGAPAIFQATNFNPTLAYDSNPTRWCSITIDGGMSAGLPLSNENQSGLLVDGYIQQSFGRWEGVDQYIEFVIGPSLQAMAPNLPWSWKQGQSLADAVKATLLAGFPDCTVAVSVNQNIVAPQTQPGQYYTLEQFGTYVNQTSRARVSTPGYLGYSIYPTQTGFLVWDGTVEPANTTQIDITDLIGQPTWLDAVTMTFKTVMRADISVGGLVEMPPQGVIYAATASSFAQYHAKPSFQGLFYVTSVRHLGRFRERDAGAWVTVFQAVPK